MISNGQEWEVQRCLPDLQCLNNVCSSSFSQCVYDGDCAVTHFCKKTVMFRHTLRALAFPYLSLGLCLCQRCNPCSYKYDQCLHNFQSSTAPYRTCAIRSGLGVACAVTADPNQEWLQQKCELDLHCHNGICDKQASGCNSDNDCLPDYFCKLTVLSLFLLLANLCTSVDLVASGGCGFWSPILCWPVVTLPYFHLGLAHYSSPVRATQKTRRNMHNGP